MTDLPTLDNTALQLGSLLSRKTNIDQRVTKIDHGAISVAHRHRILPLLAWRLMRADGSLDCPFDIQAPLLDGLRQAAALELGLKSGVSAMLGIFAAANIDVLLLKGAALAYTDYPAPYLRPRGDTDILVRREDRARAHDALLRGGFRECATLASARVSQQSQYTRSLRTRVELSIDLHWRTFNPEVFAGILTFEELWAFRRAVPAVGPAAFAPGPVHTVLLSLLHRVAHHELHPNLLWLHDIHLVASSLLDEEWAWFIELTARHDISALCAHGLCEAQELFSTAMPPTAVEWIAVARQRAVPARFRVFQKSGRRVIDMFASDFAALGWRGRAGLVREHLLPSPDYMHARYGRAGFARLPLLYLLRAAAGAWRWFRRDLFR